MPEHFGRYIQRVGVELEGLWLKPSRLCGGIWHHDGSVDVRDDSSEDGHDVDDGDQGEYVSQPCSNRMQLERFVLDNYPDYVNESCGLHVHISFRHPKYRAYTEEYAFYEAYLSAMKDIGEVLGMRSAHHYWKRWRGEPLLDQDHSYCAREWKPDLQFDGRDHGEARYCHLNYCYRKHGTLENRMLPMFHKPETALKAVLAYCTWVEEYLKERNKLPEFATEAVAEVAMPESRAEERILVTV